MAIATGQVKLLTCSAGMRWCANNNHGGSRDVFSTIDMHLAWNGR